MSIRLRRVHPENRGRAPNTESTRPDATGDESFHAPERLVGRLLADRWRVDRLLSTGGMSLVYSATHRNGKRVAIKALRPELSADPSVRRRFLREAWIVNRVPHDGVVPILDDVEGERVFLVMELLDGATLEELSRNAVCEPGEAIYVIERLLEILVVAHSVGVVHRDVKPSNAFLTRKGTVRLLDFGIARYRPDAADHLTRDGALLGTPGFMAPEQARGQWDQVDERTDVWAVGATLFRLLTSRRVHEAATAQACMIAAGSHPAPPLASVRAGLPAPLAAFVDTALRFDPSERWGSAREMLDALAPVREGIGPFRWHTLVIPESAPETPPDAAHDASLEVPALERSAGLTSRAEPVRPRVPWASRAAWISTGAAIGIALGLFGSSAADDRPGALGARTLSAAMTPERVPDPPLAAGTAKPAAQVADARTLQPAAASKTPPLRARLPRAEPPPPVVEVGPAPASGTLPPPADSDRVAPLEQFLDDRE